MSEAPEDRTNQKEKREDTSRPPARLTGIHAAVNLIIGVLAIPFCIASVWALSILMFGSGLAEHAEENDPFIWAIGLGVTGVVPIGAWWIFNLAYMQTKGWKFSWEYWGLALFYWFVPAIVIAPLFLVF